MRADLHVNLWGRATLHVQLAAVVAGVLPVVAAVVAAVVSLATTKNTFRAFSLVQQPF